MDGIKGRQTLRRQRRPGLGAQTISGISYEDDKFNAANTVRALEPKLAYFYNLFFLYFYFQYKINTEICNENYGVS